MTNSASRSDLVPALEIHACNICRLPFDLLSHINSADYISSDNESFCNANAVSSTLGLKRCNMVL